MQLNFSCKRQLQNPKFLVMYLDNTIHLVSCDEVTIINNES
jgi:hypothetical protein